MRHGEARYGVEQWPRCLATGGCRARVGRRLTVMHSGGRHWHGHAQPSVATGLIALLDPPSQRVHARIDIQDFLPDGLHLLVAVLLNPAAQLLQGTLRHRVHQLLLDDTYGDLEATEPAFELLRTLAAAGMDLLRLAHARLEAAEPAVHLPHTLAASELQTQSEAVLRLAHARLEAAEPAVHLPHTLAASELQTQSEAVQARLELLHPEGALFHQVVHVTQALVERPSQVAPDIIHPFVNLVEDCRHGLRLPSLYLAFDLFELLPQY
mmetsp:Transcript_104460/g.276846  ORF Transcript_104460/g.276846 Transcript_104460/m.276846 type:complete len:267 (-) Transcript_104460:737-1537(-)